MYVKVEIKYKRVRKNVIVINVGGSECVVRF